MIPFVAALSFVTIAVHAQQSAPEPRPSSTHHFFDRWTIASTAVESSALLADGYYTQLALTKYPTIVSEGDPLARPWVERGWPGQIAGGALFVTADAGLRYWLHRTDHHRLERFVPLILTVYGIAGAMHSQGTYSDLQSFRPR